MSHTLMKKKGQGHICVWQYEVHVPAARMLICKSELNTPPGKKKGT